MATAKVTYDPSGNPETITTSDPEAPALEYLYDHTNRVVAVQDGDTISGSYLYEDTEPDLRIQMDDRTMRVGSGAVRQSASIGDILSVVYARPYGSLLDAVRFDEATGTFELPSDLGLPPPDAVTLNSLTRRKLTDVDAGGIEPRINFDRPSNVMFLPPEYATINCASCIFNGVILKGNGVTGTLAVQQGTSVTLVASQSSGSSCANLLFDRWTINGVYMPWSTSTQVHTFSTPGTYQVQAIVECTPCDLIRVGYLTVNVTTTPPSGCGTNATLQTLADATIPSNRARTKLGVGEKTKLSLIPAPNCAVSWGLSGGSGALSATSGSSITFTAHERASTATVKATVNGIQRTVTYNVVEPASESAVKAIPDFTYPAGTQGAGMKLDITVHPTDVSFANVEMRELSGPATNISGYFTDFPPSDLAHSPKPDWIPLSAQNKWGDDAAFSGFPSPWSAGGFEWDIPVRWRVRTTVNEGVMPKNRLQTFSITGASGTSTVSKLGQSATRSP